MPYEGQHMVQGPDPSQGLTLDTAAPSPGSAHQLFPADGADPVAVALGGWTTPPGLGQGLTPEPRGRPALGTGGSPQILVDTPSEQSALAMPAPLCHPQPQMALTTAPLCVWVSGGRARGGGESSSQPHDHGLPAAARDMLGPSRRQHPGRPGARP